jgi:hypothetical protein
MSDEVAVATAAVHVGRRTREKPSSRAGQQTGPSHVSANGRWSSLPCVRAHGISRNPWFRPCASV